MELDDDFESLLHGKARAPSVRDGRTATRIVAVPFRSTLEEEAARYALRIVEGQRWHARLMERGRVRDADALTLMGLDASGADRDALDLHELRQAVANRHVSIEKRRRRCRMLDRNIGALGDCIKLNATERAILRLAAVATQADHFNDLMRLCVASEIDLVRALASAAGMRQRDVLAACAPSAPLRRSGLLSSWGKYDYSCNHLQLEQPIVNALSMPRFDEQRFLCSLARRAPAPSLTLADFAHVRNLSIARRYVGDAMRRARRGVNILIHGRPGTGKTEFVRALAQELGGVLHEVPNEDGDGDPISGSRRFSAYGICQSLLASRRGQLILFDEVEDVFGSGGDAMELLFGGGRRGGSPDALRKSWINQTLEENPVPAFWVCNSIGAIDHAWLRRFDLIMAFETPPESARRRIVEQHFPEGTLSRGCVERLAAREELVPAFVARAARVSKALRTKDVAQRDAHAQAVVDSMMAACGYGTTLPVANLPAHYDPAFLNADRDLAVIAEGLRCNRDGARLCLHGAPGTGKSAFALHLGRVLDRRVLVKRGSDLLSKWLGETEMKIAAAFRDARDDGAILVIDEADGFLRERAGAAHSWEVTQVNELLTQMEAFDGIFIASTNLVEALDAASLRRFDFKIRFDWLTRDQRRAMLARLCANDDRLDEAFAVLDRQQQVAPGDFASVLRQLRVTGEAATALRVASLVAREVALKPGARKRAIGFAANG